MLTLLYYISLNTHIMDKSQVKSKWYQLGIGEKRRAIAETALEIAGDIGWNKHDLPFLIETRMQIAQGSVNLYFQSTIDIVSEILYQFDLLMLQRTDLQNIDKMHLKVLALLSTRFREMLPIRRYLERITSFLSLPYNLPHAAKFAWKLADTIWLAAGDKSTDYNYYSKRSILSGVYSSSLLYFLNDDSKHIEDTISFIKCQLAGIVKIAKLKRSIMGLKQIP